MLLHLCEWLQNNQTLLAICGFSPLATAFEVIHYVGVFILVGIIVLVDLRAVVDGHVPAAEVDHPRARGAMHGVKRGLLEHAFSRQKKKKGEAVHAASPRLSFYLRDLQPARRSGFSPEPISPNTAGTSGSLLSCVS